MQNSHKATQTTHPLIHVCRELHGLTRNLHIFKSRVQFVVLAYKYNLVREIVSYELWDRGFEGLGERQLDDCFEMGDSEEVVMELLRVAKAENFIENIRSHIGDESFKRWCGYTPKQAALF